MEQRASAGTLLAGGFATALLFSCSPRPVADGASTRPSNDAPPAVTAPQTSSSAPATTSATPPPTTMTTASPDLAALAQEFRTLRTLKGHFSGGTWNDTVDHHGGRKGVVMRELGRQLGDGPRAKAEIEALLGPPDEVFPRQHMMFRHAYRGGDPRVTELLAYHWRGGHDMLIFASDGAKVLSAGWWHALE